MSEQFPKRAEPATEAAKKSPAKTRYVAPSIEKTSRLAEVTGMAAATPGMS